MRMLDFRCWMLVIPRFIRQALTNIQHPTSNIQHPTSNIQHPASSGLQNATYRPTPKEQSMQFFANPVQVKNLGAVERWASVVGGAALVSYGVKKRSQGGIVLAILGGDLIYRGTTGY